jgi:pimeloyl-ACP methyl ester carboxylesterase
VALALGAGCSGSGRSSDAGPGPDAGSQSDETSTTLAPFAGASDFYAVPDPLPEGEHGRLIRYQPVDELDIAGARAWRVMYLSEDVAGDAIAVTGTVLVPEGEGEAPAGGRPILSIAHGTTGVADECAPSKNPVPTELSLMAPFVQQGYLVAHTDYEGLGTPGRHPYLVGESEGRGVLDAARAAGQLPEAAAGDRLAIFGYSQGGHGALWAGQLAAEWVPELDLVGTVAGAPATEIPVVLSAAGSLPIAGLLFMLIAGYHEAYPDAALSSVLTPEGETALAAVDEGCVREVVGHFAGGDSAALLQPDAASVEPWATLARENNPGNVASDSPVLIVHSAADQVVPAGLSELLFERMCGAGQVVERRVYDKGQGHVEAVPDAVSDGFAWIGQRMAGVAPTSTCPTG